MKSKTSFFNITVFKKNITHYWPLWVLYLSYLLVFMPFGLWIMLSEDNYYTASEQMSRPFYIMRNTLETGLFPPPVFLFSVIMAMAVFSYLYSAKNANMIHSLPVSRLELFSTNYLSGLLFLAGPEFLAFVLSVLVCVANQMTNIQYLFIWFLYCLGMTFFAYSLAVFVAMFTGQLLAMPVYYFILNYLYVGCLYIVSSLIGLISYGVSDYWHPGKSCILSPIYYLGNNLRVNLVFDKGSDIVTGVTVTGGTLVAGYAAVGVVITAAAYWLYMRRQIETAGDMISIGIVKPVFRWGVALCGGAVLSVAVAKIINEYRTLDVFLCIVVCIIVFGFLCFFIAEMLLQKNFRVFRKKRFLEWLGFTAAAVIFVSLFKFDVFGVERYVPDASEIECAFVNMDFPMVIPQSDIPEVLKLHQKAIENKKLFMEVSGEAKGYYYTTFRYYLKDGSMVERRYPLPIGEEYLKDGSSPTAKILEWENSPEQLKTQILGWDYANSSYYSVNLDVFNENGEGDGRVISGKKMNKFMQAVEADVEAGNFAPYYIRSVYPDEESYFNGISLSYYNKSENYDTWDYYSNYLQLKNTSGVTREKSREMYITIGPECKNVMRALEELGITDESWKLMTYDEYRNTLEQLEQTYDVLAEPVK